MCINSLEFRRNLPDGPFSYRVLLVGLLVFCSASSRYATFGGIPDYAANCSLVVIAGWIGLLGTIVPIAWIATVLYLGVDA
jgi:hypothetical protein